MVYTIGESLIDIIFENNEARTAKAGGSMLNTAVSLGRSGIEVHHISEYSDDKAGDMIHNFLIQSNVGVDYIYRYSEGKTAIALAFLDEKKDASYSFYKQYPEKRLETNLPDFQSGDIFLFGSFYSLKDEIRERVLELVYAAKNNNSTVIYDPNIRHPHKREIPALRNRITENLIHSNIVRASDLDFKNIFDIENAEKAWELCREKEVDHLIYTMNAKGVYHFSGDGSSFYESGKIEPISTIGAGDSFNAGIIKGILDSTAAIDWDKVIRLGIDFATEVCLSMDNYIAIRK